MLSGVSAGVILSTAFMPLTYAEDNKSDPEFKGKIGRSYEESEEWWPEQTKSPDDAANVLLILLDDTGYAQLGAYGGLTNTPNIDKLAQNGLLFNNFHTCALSSPSRASIMAGRNHHNIGLGSHAISAMGFPGYNAIASETKKSVAKTLEKNGYINYALGKWDHTPLNEVSSSGPFDRWPVNEGFQHYYGFMAADINNYFPVLYTENTPIEPWRNKEDSYHLTTDLADKAIEYINAHESISPDKPFMVFWAPGAMHSPHHTPQEYRDKYKGKFDMGWDKARETILKNQIEKGIVPPNTKLTQRPKDIPAWDSFNENEKKMYARQMEAFAGMLEHTDNEIGKMIKTLENTGVLDNTIIILTSDNGASGEGGLAGTYNEVLVLNGIQTPFEGNMKRYENWGFEDTYPHYHAGWAMAGNTPFKYYKQIVHRGGQSDPLIIQWPKGIDKKYNGQIRSQYHHIIDIAPTILETAKLQMEDTIDGVKQTPMDGVSIVYAFNNPDVKTKHSEQYYEMFGNRGLDQDGWQAVTIHGNRMPWDMNSTYPFENDVWELYNLNEDFSGNINVADKYPEKLEAMKKRWDELALQNNVYPLYDNLIIRLTKLQSRMYGDKKVYTYYHPGTVRISETISAPVKNRSHKIETSIDTTGNESGVIVSCGGLTGGYTLFIKDNKVYFDYNSYNTDYYTLESPELKPGKNDIQFNFIKTDNCKGIGQLFINGKKVDEVEMPRIHSSIFSVAETFDIGRDTGTPVSKLYQDDFLFNGNLDKVTITLTD